ncbi:uncharacterized protein [Panulirus ornatus]|uniref:uncharacterized protein n=1 Tax=Panulirus ornatus TaxID=150431 RepID=UPI003A881DF5
MYCGKEDWSTERKMASFAWRSDSGSRHLEPPATLGQLQEPPATLAQLQEAPATLAQLQEPPATLEQLQEPPATHAQLHEPPASVEDDAQTSYNRACKKPRCIVERGIGQLKGRWQVLHGGVTQGHDTWSLLQH